MAVGPKAVLHREMHLICMSIAASIPFFVCGSLRSRHASVLVLWCQASSLFEEVPHGPFNVYLLEMSTFWAVTAFLSLSQHLKAGCWLWLPVQQFAWGV